MTALVCRVCVCACACAPAARVRVAYPRPRSAMFSGGHPQMVFVSDSMQVVLAADTSHSIPSLVRLFHMIFLAVPHTNQASAFDSFQFDDFGALVTMEHMNMYTEIIHSESPCLQRGQAFEHLLWVLLVVISSLKAALERLPGRPSPLVIAVCGMFMHMAESMLEPPEDSGEESEESDSMWWDRAERSVPPTSDVEYSDCSGEDDNHEQPL